MIYYTRITKRQGESKETRAIPTATFLYFKPQYFEYTYIYINYYEYTYIYINILTFIYKKIYLYT